MGTVLDIITAVIAKLRGADKPDWTAEHVAAVVAEKATEAMVTAIAVELAKFQAALGIVLATHEVAEATQHVLEAMRTRPGTSFGALPAEQAGPNETLVDGVWVTKPEPSE